MPKAKLPAPKALPVMSPATPATGGMAVAGNIVACVGVGGLLGFGLDRAMGSAPWGLIIGLIVGFIAWLRELWGLLKN